MLHVYILLSFLEMKYFMSWFFNCFQNELFSFQIYNIVRLMAAQSLQFLDMDGFWGERKTNEERYYSDSFIKNVIVIKGSSFMCSIFSHGSNVYVRRSIKTNYSRKMEAQNLMEGGRGRGFRRCRPNYPNKPIVRQLKCQMVDSGGTTKVSD